jgi:arylsulfatase A-like enzyme
LNILAERAIVYHNHFSSAPWTLPGTASIFTGVYPWTHRAFNSRATSINLSGIIDKFHSSNLFSLFVKEGFSTLAYSHNPYVEILLDQLNGNIEFHLESEKLYLNHDPLLGVIFPKDELATNLAQRQIFWDEDHVANSLLLSDILKGWVNNKIQKIIDEYKYEFPRRPPSLNHLEYFYLQEDATDWALRYLENQTSPYLGYFHFYPPHAPYRTRREFIDRFRGGWKPSPKPEHIFSEGEPENKILKQRRYYDEFIGYVDAEFARLFVSLAESGALNNTWLILTSDHGERFERGSFGHEYLLMHNPVIHIPLLIFPPGQKDRVDVYQRTNAVDLLPTLLNTMGIDIPSYCEGEILPPFQKKYRGDERTTYAMNPRDNLPHSKITEGVYTIFMENYKLINYFGLKQMKGYDEYYELYDIENDPEELNDLYDSHRNIANELINELITAMNRADQPYT